MKSISSCGSVRLISASRRASRLSSATCAVNVFDAATPISMPQPVYSVPATSPVTGVAAAGRPAHGLWLLGDPPQHEGLVAPLLRFLVVPVELLHLGMLDLDAVLEETNGGRRDLDDLAVVGEHCAARLAEERGDV